MKSSALRISLLVVLILSATAVLGAPPQQNSGTPGAPVVTPVPVEGPVDVTPAAPFSVEGTDLGRMLRRNATVVAVPGRAGMMRLDPQGGFRSVLLMRINAEGKPETVCVTSDKSAEKFLAPKPERARQEQ